MKLIENIKDWWYSLKEEYQQSSKDKLMQKAFVQVIQEEENDRESFFILEGQVLEQKKKSTKTLKRIFKTKR